MSPGPGGCICHVAWHAWDPRPCPCPHVLSSQPPGARYNAPLCCPMPQPLFPPRCPLTASRWPLQLVGLQDPAPKYPSRTGWDGARARHGPAWCRPPAHGGTSAHGGPTSRGLPSSPHSTASEGRRTERSGATPARAGCRCHPRHPPHPPPTAPTTFTASTPHCTHRIHHIYRIHCIHCISPHRLHPAISTHPSHPAHLPHPPYPPQHMPWSSLLPPQMATLLLPQCLCPSLLPPLAVTLPPCLCRPARRSRFSWLLHCSCGGPHRGGCSLEWLGTSCGIWPETAPQRRMAAAICV